MLIYYNKIIINIFYSDRFTIKRFYRYYFNIFNVKLYFTIQTEPTLVKFSEMN
jgi:hypothetical protein